MTKPRAKFLTRIAQYGPLVPEDEGALADLLGEEVEIEGRTDLALEGDERTVAYAVEEGWAYCYKDLEDGRRQILGFQLPGDTLGLRLLLLRTSDFSFGTLTDCRLYRLNKCDLEALFAEHPRLAAGVLWTLARDQAILVEHVLSLGRRSAEERLAHMLCELGCRAVTCGLDVAGGFHCPAPQTVLADALGLSVVHLNRTIRPMRERGLVEIGATGLVVPDLARLIAETGFDPRFLGIYPGDSEVLDQML